MGRQAPVWELVTSGLGFQKVLYQANHVTRDVLGVGWGFLHAFSSAQLAGSIS